MSKKVQNFAFFIVTRFPDFSFKTDIYRAMGNWAWGMGHTKKFGFIPIKQLPIKQLPNSQGGIYGR
jgi:hypothetical protein